MNPLEDPRFWEWFNTWYWMFYLISYTFLEYIWVLIAAMGRRK